MKSQILILLAALAAASAMANPSAHATHNLLLYGEQTIFASHIVYLQPHNFQVILEVSLPEAAKELYLAQKAAHPGDAFLLLLDHMDLRDVNALGALSGKLLRKNAAGARFELAADVRLPAGTYRVVYFNELPLSLE